MRRTRGFTLIELLLVIGIIGLLVALFLPTISMVQQRLIKLECKTNLKKCHGIMMAYAGKYRGLLPPFGTESIYEAQHTHPGGTPAGRHLMIETLVELGARPEYFSCPAHGRYRELSESAYYNWEIPHWSAGGSDNWIKSYSTPGYVFFQHSDNFTRHPRGGNIIPNHWATWSRFLTGRFLPRTNNDPGNPPLGADVLRIDSVYRGFWHDPLRESLGGSEYDENCILPGGGGHTLFLAGDVVWFDWGELEAQGAGYEANDDKYYYFAMEKPGE